MEQLPRDLIVPFVYQKNQTAWGRNIRVVAWNYSESGDGKSMLDGHFAYFKMNVRSFVLGEQKNVDSPRLAYLADVQREAGVNGGELDGAGGARSRVQVLG